MQRLIPFKMLKLTYSSVTVTRGFRSKSNLNMIYTYDHLVTLRFFCITKIPKVVPRNSLTKMVIHKSKYKRIRKQIANMGLTGLIRPSESRVYLNPALPSASKNLGLVSAIVTPIKEMV